MNPMAYTIRQLAAGSYDVLLDGRLIASVVLEVDRSGVTREWLVDLLNETALDKRPAPFNVPAERLRHPSGRAGVARHLTVS